MAKAKHRTTVHCTSKMTATVATLGAVATMLAPSVIAAPPTDGSGNPTYPGSVTEIYVDGTMPTALSQSEEGAYDFAKSSFGDMPGDNLWVLYPRSFGVLTGLTDPGYDESRDSGGVNTAGAIRQARAQNRDQPIMVYGYSQGADSNVEARRELRAEGFDLSNVYFYDIGSPRNNDGGIQARFSFLPAGVYVPLVGITIGGPGSGNPPSDDTNVVQVARQYDLVADAPVYILNVFATTNAIAGFILLHGSYSEVDLEDPRNQVTTANNGHLTNILVYTEELPLVTVLKIAGVPDPLADAMEPLLRSLVDAGYDRPDPNVPDSYPTEPVPFKLLPPPDKIAEDKQNISVGFQQTVQELADLANSGTASTPEPSLEQVTIEENQEPEGDVQDQGSPDSVLRSFQQPDEQSKPKMSVLRKSLKALTDRQGDNSQLGSDPDDLGDDVDADKNVVSGSVSVQSSPNVSSPSQDDDTGDDDGGDTDNDNGDDNGDNSN